MTQCQFQCLGEEGSVRSSAVESSTSPICASAIRSLSALPTRGRVSMARTIAPIFAMSTLASSGYLPTSAGVWILKMASAGRASSHPRFFAQIGCLIARVRWRHHERRCRVVATRSEFRSALRYRPVFLFLSGGRRQHHCRWAEEERGVFIMGRGLAIRPSGR